jgi:hypothetical protein
MLNYIFLLHHIVVGFIEGVKNYILELHIEITIQDFINCSAGFFFNKLPYFLSRSIIEENYFIIQLNELFTNKFVLSFLP